jgi:hypothetical protein
MPDYASLSTQIEQYKTAASALMNSGTLSADDLALVGASLNAIANSLGVADINNALTSAIANINTTKDAAITAFNSGTNGTRLTGAEANIIDHESRIDNIEGFVSTNGAQYTVLQSTVSALQTSLSTVPSSWQIATTSLTALNNDRIFVGQAGITITLPLNPTLGYNVTIIDGLGNAGTTNFTIARNAQRIMGLAENLVVNVNGAVARLVYVDSVRGWALT